MTGINATLGVAAEPSYGTYQAPARWVEFNSETLEKRKTVLQSMGLRGGGLFPRASRRVVPLNDAGGNVSLDVATKGMGLLLSHMIGSTPVLAQQGGTAAWRQIHTPGASGVNGKFLTIQKAVPKPDGTKTPFTYKGCKVVGWTLAVDVGGILTLSLDIDARQEVTTEALVPSSYVETEVLHFAQGTLKLGGTASTTGGVVSIVGGTTVAEVTAASLTGTNALKTDRNYLGSAGLKAEPVTNGFADYGGSLAAEFVNQATVYDLFAADASVSLQLTFTGSVIAGAFSNALDIVVPAVKFDGETPKVGGPDLVAMTAPFKILDDGTNAPIQFAYTSTDTAA